MKLTILEYTTLCINKVQFYHTILWVTMATPKSFISLIVCFCLVIFSFIGTHAVDVSHDGRAIKIDGKRRVLISGSIHYPRSTPEVNILIYLSTLISHPKRLSTLILVNLIIDVARVNPKSQRRRIRCNWNICFLECTWTFTSCVWFFWQ